MYASTRLALAAVLAGTFSACSGGHDHEPAPLAAGLRGGLSPDEAARTLQSEARSWRVIENRTVPESGKRPRYSSLIVSTGKTTDMGQPGELVLVFFNDRLLATRFFADDLSAYRAALEHARGPIVVGKKSKLDKDTMVWTATDDHGRQFLALEDAAIAAEESAWISRFG